MNSPLNHAIRFIIRLAAVVAVHVGLGGNIATGQTLQIERIAEGSLQLNASGEKGAYIVESSTDLGNFKPTDIVLFETPFASESIPVDSTSSKSKFFRMASAPSSLSDSNLTVSTLLAGSYFGTLRYNDVEINYFGERNENGWPKKLTRISGRIGEKKFDVTDKAGIALDQLPEPPPPTTFPESQLDKYSGKGFVVVSRASADTPIPGHPIVQVVGRDQYLGDIAYEVPTVKVAEYGLDTIYEYEVVWLATLWTYHPDKLLRALGSLECAGSFAASLGAFGALQYALCLSELEDNTPRVWPPTSQPILELRWGKVRGVIPAGGSYENYASEWRELFAIDDYSINTLAELPLLLIDLKAPEKKVQLSKDYSISDGFSDAARVRDLHFDFGPLLDSVPHTSIKRVEWRVAQRASAVDAKLTAYHPNGGYGGVTIQRTQSLGSLTPGIVVPYSQTTRQSVGTSFLHGQKAYQFSLNQSPYTVSIEGDGGYQDAIESNPATFANYRNPFSIQVVASQGGFTYTYMGGMAAPDLEQSKATLSGSVTITLILQ